MYKKSISAWAEKYGSVTTFSYILYSEIWDDEVSLLGGGINIILISEGMNPLFKIFTDEVDRSRALSLNEYRGTSLQIVFPKSSLHLESLVDIAVKKCMESLAIKFKKIGAKEVKIFA